MLLSELDFPADRREIDMLVKFRNFDHENGNRNNSI